MRRWYERLIAPLIDAPVERPPDTLRRVLPVFPGAGEGHDRSLVC